MKYQPATLSSVEKFAYIFQDWRKVRCSPLNFPCSLLLRAANDGELPRYLDEKLLLRPLLLHRHVARGHSGRPWEGRCLWLGVEGESSAGLVQLLERWRPYRRV